MLFMGEEWAASTPFQFFTSHSEPELGKATAEGRKAEFAEHGWDAADVPDPQDPQTFQRSKLDWSEVDTGGHGEMLRCYRDLLALRHDRTELTDPWLDELRVDYDEDGRWIVLYRGALRVACNLGGQPATLPVTGHVLLASAEVHAGASDTALAAESFAVLDTAA